MTNDLKQNNMQNTPQGQEQMKLDDARRVKVLSPGMLVFKRFIRNKLAVAGIIILVIMFLYSFIGPLFSPYKRAQIFVKEVEEWGDYATGKFNNESRFLGKTSSSINTAVLKALGSMKKAGKYALTAGQEIPFTAGNDHYTLKVINPDGQRPSCALFGTTKIARVVKGKVDWYDQNLVDEGLLELIRENAGLKDKGEELLYNDVVISIESDRIESSYYAPSLEPFAISTYNIYSALRGKVAKLQSDAQFLHNVSAAVFNQESEVLYNGETYRITGNAQNGMVLTDGDGVALFNIARTFRSSMIMRDTVNADGEEISEEADFFSVIGDSGAFIEAAKSAIDAGEASFNFENSDYTIEKSDTEFHVLMEDAQLAAIVTNSFDPVESKYDLLNEDYLFAYAAEQAISDKQKTFEYAGERYSLGSNDYDYTVKNAAGSECVLISDIAYGAARNGTEITVDFILKLQEAMRGKQDYFSFVNQYGEQTDARITIVNGNYYVQTMQKTSLVDARAGLSSEHPLGTDVNGMDVFTRLMYGGRVSLLVGFVVVLFEIVLGVIIGGVSGYFGGVVDTILMRFVELFNAIPFYPMLIILGSVMDNLHFDAYTRLMMTMVILGILGWTGIARIVRGQILSLREQDFMIATEATGIRTSRRIFRHLIPNVMPLLIVNATAGLGSVILTEATLGFLGLGVKYPMASWGSIINQVNDMQVMKTAWWIWIPAGLLILLTVLGFNFVGDGLRDAFDPKMKR